VTRFAESGGVRIAWEERGSGPVLLLVHGLGYARWGWEPLVPLLSEHHRLLLFDNRGIGESDVVPGPYTARMMMSDAVAVLDAAGAETVNVVGTSLGGMIAQELAAAHPDRIDHLVLMSTTPGGIGAHPMPAVTVELFGRAATLDPSVALRLFVENALSDPPDAGLVDRIMAHRLRIPQDPAGWQAQAAAGTTFDPGDLDITVPTLVIHGEQDRVVDVRNAFLLAERIPGARVETLPGGHLMFWEDPRAVATLIRSFLEHA
jgi:pimeloyl-ACP methyl ester carboxylesterase